MIKAIDINIFCFLFTHRTFYIVSQYTYRVFYITLLCSFEITWTYKINRKTHAYNFSLLKRYRAYFISNSFSSFLTIVSFSLFSIALTHLPALVLGSFIGLLWNFVMNKKVIWHHKPITNTTVSGVK